jgi:hypothetical protein
MPQHFIKYSNNVQLDLLCTKFFEHKIQIKMLHFQTRKYNYHKILDDYYNQFEEYFDKFMEVAQGNYNCRLSLKEIKLNVSMINDNEKSINELLTKFCQENLFNLFSTLPNNEALTTIRDDIINLINKTKYLISFE